jgi:hypothetical protein
MEIERTKPATYRELKRLIFRPSACPIALIPFIQEIIIMGAPCPLEDGITHQYRHFIPHWDLTLCFMREQQEYTIMQIYWKRLQYGIWPCKRIQLKFRRLTCSCNFAFDDRLIDVHYTQKVCVQFTPRDCTCGLAQWLSRTGEGDMIILEEAAYIDPPLYKQITLDRVQ